MNFHYICVHQIFSIFTKVVNRVKFVALTDVLKIENTDTNTLFYIGIFFYLSGWNDFSKNKKRACNVGTPPPR